uniref:Disintegrin domain-containing protein n=1 Tax=Hucho hucho TaxID=62062 RepID=A0A4W5N9Z0_9TELE
MHVQHCLSSSPSGSTLFSDCSASDFERLVLRGGGVCLLNQPSQSNIVSVAKCGNGMLEEGEDCDCGTPQECTNKCCDAATCKLTWGSACAQGSCCKDCKISVSGTPCRGSVNTCDLPEYCNGSTSFCPSDFYIMDGLLCENDAAYCYEGRCQTYDYQCKFLFEKGRLLYKMNAAISDTFDCTGLLNKQERSVTLCLTVNMFLLYFLVLNVSSLIIFFPGARKAAEICFQTANLKGDTFGNCGLTSAGTYVKCSLA